MKIYIIYGSIILNNVQHFINFWTREEQPRNPSDQKSLANRKRFCGKFTIAPGFEMGSLQ